MENYVELKLRVQELLLRGTDFLDRLLIDYKSRSYKKVLTVEYETLTASQRIHYAKCKSESNMPFKYLPNCASYVGESNSHSWIDMLFGQRRRSASEGGTIISWRNKLRNNFLRYRFREMGYYRDLKKSRLYWHQALNLMVTDVFVITSFNHVARGWEKTMKAKQVKKLLKEVKKMLRTLPTTMEYRRVYIPKVAGQPDGPQRPLGVPTKAWRVYLHMWNVMVNWWVSVHLNNSQHAYQPGKGTWTAWKELYSKLKNELQIYEFDLRNFFGGVNLDYNQKEMERLGIPTEIAEYLRKVNQSIVKLADEDKMDEKANRMILWNSNGDWNPNLDPKVKGRLMKLDTPSERESKEKEIKRLETEGYSRYSKVGVPQGAATSCTLSLINLRGLFEKLKGLVMYADDGLYFPKTEAEDVSVPEAGVTQAYEKSGWVKRSGVWEKSLKFLGLEYIPPNVNPKEGGDLSDFPRIRAFTRNGSRLEFDMMNQFRIFLKKEYRQEFERWSEYWDLAKAGVEGVYPPREGGEVISLEEWVDENWSRFQKTSHDERLGLLFSTEEGTGAMASLYQGDWVTSSEEMAKFAYKEWSWCHQRWGAYLRERINEGDLCTLVKAQLEWTELDEEKREKLEKLTSEAHEHSEEAVLAAKRFLFVHNDRITESRKDKFDPAVEKALKTWKELLETIVLTEGNSSSFATDDLLTQMGNQGEWSYNDDYKYRYYRIPRAVIKGIKEREKRKNKNKHT